MLRLCCSPKKQSMDQMCIDQYICQDDQCPKELMCMFPVDFGLDLSLVRGELLECKQRYHREVWRIICDKALSLAGAGTGAWRRQSETPENLQLTPQNRRSSMRKSSLKPRRSSSKSERRRSSATTASRRPSAQSKLSRRHSAKSTPRKSAGGKGGKKKKDNSDDDDDDEEDDEEEDDDGDDDDDDDDDKKKDKKNKNNISSPLSTGNSRNNRQSGGRRRRKFSPISGGGSASSTEESDDDDDRDDYESDDAEEDDADSDNSGDKKKGKEDRKMLSSVKALAATNSAIAKLASLLRRSLLGNEALASLGIGVCSGDSSQLSSGGTLGNSAEGSRDRDRFRAARVCRLNSNQAESVSNRSGSSNSSSGNRQPPTHAPAPASSLPSHRAPQTCSVTNSQDELGTPSRLQQHQSSPPHHRYPSHRPAVTQQIKQHNDSHCDRCKKLRR